MTEAELSDALARLRARERGAFDLVRELRAQAPARPVLVELADQFAAAERRRQSNTGASGPRHGVAKSSIRRVYRFA
ncbi:MAG: hypothetical protein WDO24_17455 [Pseudomonadota bacterium]